MTTAPPPAQADDKDWTWVLDKPCPECSVAVGELSIGEIADLNRRCADEWSAVLLAHPTPTTRPAPEIWSPVEYGCHVRDVFGLFIERLELMLAQDNPTFANWNPNITAEAERYDLAEATTVAAEIVQAGHEIADRFAALSAVQLDRPAQRSDGANFSVLSFARYEIHDPVHHLWDVTGSPLG